MTDARVSRPCSSEFCLYTGNNLVHGFRHFRFVLMFRATLSSRLASHQAQFQQRFSNKQTNPSVTLTRNSDKVPQSCQLGQGEGTSSRVLPVSPTCSLPTTFPDDLLRCLSRICNAFRRMRASW